MLRYPFIVLFFAKKALIKIIEKRKTVQMASIFG